MVPEDLARQALTADSAFCIAVGSGAALISRRVGRRLQISTPLVAAAGLASVAWGGWVAGLSGGADWRRATRLVAAGNTAGAVGLTALAATRPDTRARVGPGILAGQVGAFAAVQIAALVWDRKAHIGTEVADRSSDVGQPGEDAGSEPAPPAEQ